MLDRRSVTLLNIIFTIKSQINSVPFIWNSKSFTLIPISGYHIIKHWIIVLCVIFQSVFQIVNFLNCWSTTPLFIKCMHLQWVIGYSLAAISGILNFWKRYELASFINHFFQIHRQVQCKSIKSFYVEKVKVSFLHV